MIYSELSKWPEIPGLSKSQIFTKAFQWIVLHAHDADEKIYPLDHPDFYIRVMSYDLKNRDLATFENHLQTIDLQYTIEGAEAIEFHPYQSLKSKNNYSSEKDVEHFFTPLARGSEIHNLKGYFSLIFPGEPHMPQLKIDGFNRVKKLVVKIPYDLAMNSFS